PGDLQRAELRPIGEKAISLGVERDARRAFQVANERENLRWPSDEPRLRRHHPRRRRRLKRRTPTSPSPTALAGDELVGAPDRATEHPPEGSAALQVMG